MRFYFIFILYYIVSDFVFPVSATAQAPKVCHTYFETRDVFESFSSLDKQAFYTLVQKYSFALSQPHHLVEDMKRLIDLDLKQLLTRKTQTADQYYLLLSFFKESVRDWIHRREIDLKKITLNELEHRELLLRQAGQMADLKMLLEHHNVSTQEDLKAAIVATYGKLSPSMALVILSSKKESDLSKIQLLEIDFLIDEGVNIDLNFMNLTPLSRSVEKENVPLVRKLINKGAKLETLNKKLESPLMIAAKNGNIEIMKILVDAGADIDIQDRFGNTPLMRAKAMNHVEIVKLLDR